jgi:rubredoxin
VGAEMKKLILALFFTIMMVYSASAQSTLALQEKCAEGAKKFFFEFKGQYRSDSNLWPDYTSHYNKKLDRCFIHIFVSTFKDGKEENLSQYLFDVFEAGQQSNTLAYGRFQKFPDRTKTPVCKVGDKICHSEAEFEALIKPYMEE